MESFLVWRYEVGLDLCAQAFLVASCITFPGGGRYGLG